MKPHWILLLGVLLLVGIVSATPTIPHIDAAEIRSVSLSHIEFTPQSIGDQVISAIDSMKEVLGISKKSSSQSIFDTVPNTEDLVTNPKQIVMMGEEPIAIVSTDSKFIDLPYYTFCTPYQYGTEDWYSCEQQVSVMAGESP
jgi:hypothetical protein